MAKILGQRLDRKVISTDAEIVKEAGQSIPHIVEQFGWDHFRELETQMCREASGSSQFSHRHRRRADFEGRKREDP